ncbi:PINIT domain-containing protein [Dactylonectria macrodidyma]|uniref:PINIT domain-containing protein n=1 Tax=Dactylonectria macrodidyma TaxID=307937 RepID=A0A9P9ELY6_9HYPO|nr:PINIT domain-containing protein [Dactylonectria macrodidyma]
MASSSGLGSAAAHGSSSSFTVSRQEASSLVRQVNRLLNRQLSSVCQVNGIKSTGIKAELQNRIANLIEEAVSAQDLLRYQQIRQSVQNAISNAPASSASPARASHSHNPSSAHGRSVASPHLPQPISFSTNFSRDSASSRPAHRTAMPGMRPNVGFKPSPFYSIEAPVSDVHVCDAMSQHRNSVTVPLKLNDHPALQQCVNDKSYRVMVFCAGDSIGAQDIAFPHQSELRVNSGEVKANLRGLKNKPGSTRPVDITNVLRLRPNYTNNLEFTYALTTKKFFLVVNLCKVTSVEELVTRISAGNRIPIQSVLQEFTEKAQDADVVATSQVLSLKCPLSYMRLDLPCRGLTCAHIQCFDATSYLQLQEQGPQWLCPICNKFAPFASLAVDEYVKDILSNTPKSLETVTIEPSGKWHIKSSDDEHDKNGPQNQSSQFENDDFDDDDLEISEVNIVGRRLETPKNAASSTGTPASVGPRGIASTSAKRPAAPVIDLTLSSDEDDDEPIERPTKRQNTGTNGFHSPDDLDFLNDPLGYPS